MTTKAGIRQGGEVKKGIKSGAPLKEGEKERRTKRDR